MTQEQALPNPLLQPWSRDYGLPNFSAIDVGHFEPALEIAERAYWKQVDTIANNPAPASFANTVLAFDRSGRQWKDIALLVYNLSYIGCTPEFQAIEAGLSTRIAGFQNRLHQHEFFAKRILVLYQAKDSLPLTVEQIRILERLYLDLQKAGAFLDAQEKARVAIISEQLASMYVTFGQNVEHDEASYYLPLTESQLATLPSSLAQEARAFRADKALDGCAGAVSTYLRMFEPFMSTCPQRELRQQLWLARENRGRNTGPFDNRPLASEILTLRAQLARIHRCSSFAEFELRDSMVKSPAVVESLISQIWPSCLAAVQVEREKLTQLAVELNEPTPIMAWDWLYLMQQQRSRDAEAREQVDLRPYLSVNDMLCACFDCADRLFGLTACQVDGATLFHESAQLWRIARGDGDLVGHLITDLRARSGKQPYGFMHHFRYQRDNITPTVVVSCSFDALMSLADAVALFHEFGHALQGLLSQVSYERLSGTQVYRDWAEFPSQLFEHWLKSPAGLTSHARHHQTGQPIPPAMLDLAVAEDNVGQSWGLLQLLARVLMDLRVHGQLGDTAPDLDALEIGIRNQIGMPDDIGPRWYLANFIHLFAVGGYYAAGYYGYLWGELLSADAFLAFQESRDLFDPVLAERLLTRVLQTANAEDPASAYTDFRGRALSVTGFLAKYRLTPDDTKRLSTSTDA